MADHDDFAERICVRPELLQQARDALAQVTTSETFFRDPRGDNAGPAIDALDAALGVDACQHPRPLWAGDTPNGPQFWCAACGAFQPSHGQWQTPEAGVAPSQALTVLTELVACVDGDCSTPEKLANWDKREAAAWDRARALVGAAHGVAGTLKESDRG